MLSNKLLVTLALTLVFSSCANFKLSESVLTASTLTIQAGVTAYINTSGSFEERSIRANEVIDFVEALTPVITEDDKASTRNIIKLYYSYIMNKNLSKDRFLIGLAVMESVQAKFDEYSDEEEKIVYIIDILNNAKHIASLFLI